MKLLESVGLDDANTLLSNGSWRFLIEPRVENYSCKMVAEDKRLYKELARKSGSDIQMLSPPQTQVTSLNDINGLGDESPTRGYNTSSVGGLMLPAYPCLLNHSTSLSTSEGEEVGGFGTGESAKTCSTVHTKTLFHLISTLNASFSPDYDFSGAKSEEFCREPEAEIVVYAINEILNTYLDNFASIKDRLWQVINDEIVISECNVYSYRPDRQADPYSEGCIASFNYFFYNKNLKRILFFSVKVSPGPQTAISGYAENEDDLGYDFED